MQVPFAKPFIGNAEINEVSRVLASGWLTTGPVTARFERDFAEYLGRRYAVGVTSCTAALHLALLCYDIGPGDEVITPAMSWVATPNAVAYTGAKPVFVDVEPDTLNIDTEKIEAAITPQTRAILPVHLYGMPCDMDAITGLAREHSLWAIGDCAHAVEAEIAGRKVGSFADADCFSFWAAKNMTTGEGGMLVTDDEEVAEKARSLRNFGLKGGKRDSTGGYEQASLGWKYNMFDIQAAIGIHQLKRVEERWERRSALAERYNRLLEHLPVQVLRQDGDIRHAHHLYPVLLNTDRPRVIAGLRGIATSIHYRPLHLEPYYRETYGYSEGMFPVAEDAGRRILSLPFWPEMTEDEQDGVVNGLSEVLRG